VALAFAAAYVLRFRVDLPLLEAVPYSSQFYSSVVFLTVPAWLLLFALLGLYDRRRTLSGSREYVAIVQGTLAGMQAVAVAAFLEPNLQISRGWLLLAGALAVLLVASERFLARRAVRLLRRRGLFQVLGLIVGANEEGQALADQLLQTERSGLRLLGFLDDRLPAGTRVGALAVLGALADLPTYLADGRVGQLVIAPTAVTREQLLDLYRRYGSDDQLDLTMSSGLFEMLTTGVEVQEQAMVPLLRPRQVRITGLDAFLKGTLDYVGAGVGLLALGPLLLLLCLLVRLDSPGPIFHRRLVLGRGGKLFHALKLRTMVVDADERLARDPELAERFAAGFKLKEDPRVTRVGRWLRRTSLDELPQLWNVLRGQMSLVGPRMITAEELPRYGPWQLNLLTVKPGITGPWQVQGRADLSYEDRVLASMHYIRNYAIWLDLAILLRTIPAVLRQRGAY